MVRGMRQENWLSSCVTKAVQVAKYYKRLYLSIFIKPEIRKSADAFGMHSVCRRIVCADIEPLHQLEIKTNVKIISRLTNAGTLSVHQIVKLT